MSLQAGILRSVVELSNCTFASCLKFIPRGWMRPGLGKWSSDNWGCLYKHTKKSAVPPGTWDEAQPALLWSFHQHPLGLTALCYVPSTMPELVFKTIPGWSSGRQTSDRSDYKPLFWPGFSLNYASDLILCLVPHTTTAGKGLYLPSAPTTQETCYLDWHQPSGFTCVKKETGQHSLIVQLSEKTDFLVCEDTAATSAPAQSTNRR